VYQQDGRYNRYFGRAADQSVTDLTNNLNKNQLTFNHIVWLVRSLQICKQNYMPSID